MNVLLVEDEAGLREALAAYLRLRGLRVRALGSCAEARAALAAEAFDAIATDWRLGDGRAGDWLPAGVPALVMSGYPAEIPAGAWHVLEKPVAPSAVLEALTACDRRAAATAPELAADVRDRVALAIALAGGDGRATIVADGAFVTLTVALHDTSPSRLERIATLGGDQRVLVQDGRPVLELRLFADARPEDVTVIAWDEPWPADGALALDFGRGPRCQPSGFETLLDRAQGERRELHFLNVPGELRLWAEVLGRADAVPKRTPCGPSLPEVLACLWR
jgi:CheY-like chemotaxis protein